MKTSRLTLKGPTMGIRGAPPAASSVASSLAAPAAPRALQAPPSGEPLPAGSAGPESLGGDRLGGEQDDVAKS